MASNRIGRINEEIQRELAEQLRRLKDPRVSQVGMVSITRVDTTGDLRYSKVYISVLDSCAGSWDTASSCATPRSCNSLQTIPSPTAHIFWKSCGTRKR